MTKQDATHLIAIEIVAREIESLNDRMSTNDFRVDVEYHNEALNAAFEKQINSLSEALQKYVDKFYWNYYPVDRFMPFTLDNLEVSIPHNQSLLGSAKKLLSFTQ